MISDWSSKTVYVTGASSGIGRTLAEQFGQKGANVVLCARSEDKLNEIGSRVEANGGSSLVQSLDVRDEQSVKQSFEKTVEAFGGVDCVIANAGVSWRTNALDLDLESCRETVNINVLGLVNTLKFALDQMIGAGSGHLVAVSSMASYKGLPGKAAYCASKAAVARFAESLRLDLTDEPIDVTTVFPGYVKTPMTDHYPEDELTFLVPVDEASRKIIRAIENGQKRCEFPWQMALLSGTLSLLPDWMTDWIVTKMAATMTDAAPEGPA
ncbi:MAG: SDR family NAD(P)-dependent oxidoreductase [bacterium]